MNVSIPQTLLDRLDRVAVERNLYRDLFISMKSQEIVSTVERWAADPEKEPTQDELYSLLSRIGY